ncbi:phosphatidylinositol transfer protein [Vairimorpha necatrix]|uniref:Phosphatidylinositol transfer protein n=1 Tax=Vairimorpha necatrix TaxID=6039 RepID=A0AAX4JC91_9MICR
MTKVTHIFEFLLPLNKDEFNLANRFAILHKYKTDKSSGFRIKLIKKESLTHNVMGDVESTTKHLHLHSKIPYIVRQCIPDAACILTEISHYNDSLIHTSYKNNHFDEEIFQITVETHLTNENPFPGQEVEVQDLSNGEESIKIFKKVDIEINNWMMGWIAHEIAKDMKKELIEHHHIIMRTKEEWKNTNLTELDKLEHEIFN